MLKRILSLVVVGLLLFNGFSFADKLTDAAMITMIDSQTKKEAKYLPVDILMGGEDVLTDVPAILYQIGGSTRTLVPVRFISENLGATVKWDGAKKEVSIFYKNKLITLVIDDPIAYVNDTPYTLPDSVPPKLMNYMGIDRTLVPLRFVSDQLGMDVNWISATKTATIDKPFQKISGVTFLKDAKVPEIIIKTTGEVSANSYYVNGATIGGKNKLVLDIPNTQLSLGASAILDAAGSAHIGIYESGIGAVRAEQLSKNPFKTRLTIDLDEQLGYEVISEKSQLRIRFINSVVDVRTETIYGAETVIIKTVEEPKYNVQYWQGKVIVDIIDSTLKLNEGKNSNFRVDKGGIGYVSYSQLDPSEQYEPGDSVSRVVVSLSDPTLLENVYIEHVGTDLFVYVAGNPLNSFDYAKDGVNQSHISFTTLYPTTMSTSFDKASRTITLKLPFDAIALSEFNEHIDDNLVERVSISTTESEYIIKLTLESGAEYTNLTPAGQTDTFVLMFNNQALAYEPFISKLVIIDPGHGGKDPGALSSDKQTKEKDLNLTIGLKLKKKLENIGVKVYMTRDYDVYVGLYDRAYIANDLQADAMVSLHINANESSVPSGIQVLYSNTNSASKGFASTLLSKLLSYATGALNKGVVERPNLVLLRESKIPTVLAELGFISNSNDLRNLRDELYQDKIVEGLYQGILQSLK